MGFPLICGSENVTYPPSILKAKSGASQEFGSSSGKLFQSSHSFLNAASTRKFHVILFFLWVGKIF